MKTRAVSLVLLLAMSFVAACHRESQGGGEDPGSAKTEKHITKIRLLLDSRYEPFRSVQMKMLTRLAISRPGVQLETVDCLGSATAQLQQAEKSSSVDFLLVFPINLPSLLEALSRAKRSGTKVIVFDGQTPAEACTTAIFYDESKLGQMAGEMVVRSLRQRASDEGYASTIGRVVYLRDSGDGPSLNQRKDAFLKALTAEPGITLVHEAPVDASGTEAPARLAEAFRLQKNFDVIFCDTDLIASAASTAVTAANAPARQAMLIVGVDGAMGKGGGVDLTSKGQIDATLWRPPLVDAAWAIIEKCLDSPSFTPRPRYEQNPRPVNLETALRFLNENAPAPTVE